MAKFAELMKKDDYTPRTTKFALSRGLLTMRCTKAKKYAEETMGATLGLKNYISPTEENRVHLDTVVPMLQAAPQQIALWKRSSTRSGANYALALTKAHFPRKFTIWNESEMVILSMVRAVRPFCPDMLRLQVGLRRSPISISFWNL